MGQKIDRAVSGRRSVRFSGPLEEAAPAGGRGLLQFLRRRGYNHSGLDYRDTCVAMAARRPTFKGNSSDAPGGGMRFERADLGGLVHAQENAPGGGRDPADRKSTR